MAYKIKLTKDYNGSDTHTKINIGFSWTTFFFGCLPVLFRGEWASFFKVLSFVIFVRIVDTIAMNVSIDTFWMWWAISFVPLLMICDRVNKWSVFRMLDKGWRIDYAWIADNLDGKDFNDVQEILNRYNLQAK